MVFFETVSLNLDFCPFPSAAFRLNLAQLAAAPASCVLTALATNLPPYVSSRGRQHIKTDRNPRRNVYG